MTRKHARKDTNQDLIAGIFVQYGWSVADTHDLGNGFPDLVVSKYETWVVEIKDGDKPPSKKKLTEDEERFRERWRGTWVRVEDGNTLAVYLEEEERRRE